MIQEYSIFTMMLKHTLQIKGVIWYQGEANVGNYYDYSVSFRWNDKRLEIAMER